MVDSEHVDFEFKKSDTAGNAMKRIIDVAVGVAGGLAFVSTADPESPIYVQSIAETARELGANSLALFSAGVVLSETLWQGAKLYFGGKNLVGRKDNPNDHIDEINSNYPRR